MRTKLNTLDFQGKAKKLQKHFDRCIVGQKECTDEIVKLYQNSLSGLQDTTRPLGSMIFLGPTGTGKTYVVEKFAEFLHGSPKNVLKIDCGEFQYGHEVTKLTGSPPGYLGHRETQALLTQSRLTSIGSPSIVLFDEIEKGHDSLRGFLLGILDKGTATTGDNYVTNFNNSFVFMTTNLGAKDLYTAQGYQTGFAAKRDLTEKEITTIPINAMKTAFTPEFVNRIDRIACFNPLNQEDCRQILVKEIEKINERVFIATKKKLYVENSVVDFILSEPRDEKYGARPLRQAVEKLIMQPVSMVIGEIGQHIEVVVENYCIEFYSDIPKSEGVIGANA